MDAGFIAGLINTFSVEHLAFAFVGCFLGTAVGVLPGLGPSATMALLLPLTLHMPPLGAIIMLGGIFYGAAYGGSTTAILLNIPGEPSSIPAAIEGYPMTKQGRAGEALAMAAIVSFLAGIFGAVMVAVLGVPLARVALLFGPSEYFALVVFSLMAVTSISEGTLIQRFVMLFLGLILASIGVDSITGTPRLNFGTIELMRGLELVPLLVGMFGISEVLLQADAGGNLFRGKLGSLLSMLPRGQELARGMAASVRGTIIGFFLGLLPGMIPTVTSFLSYDVEKRIAKDPSRFGHGAIEGIGGPEAANNATSMAGFIPLMVFGIPTTGSLAIILAALQINGLQPGPTLFTEHALFAWTIIASMFVANCMLLVLNLPLVGMWARLSLVPYKYLGPAIIGFCVVGAYSGRQSMFDVVSALLAGVIAYRLRRKNWPLVPLIMGFLMGPLLEQALSQSLSLSGGSLAIFISRPYTAGILVAALVMMTIGATTIRNKIIHGGNHEIS